MATATGQRFSNGSLNSHLHRHTNGKYSGAHHHHQVMHGLVGGDDDTDGATEQFPPFDPSHDGSEEDHIVNSSSGSEDDEYTHSSTAKAKQRANGAHAVNGNGKGVALSSGDGDQQQVEQARSAQYHDTHNQDEEHGEKEEEQSHTPMSNLDPVPEADLRKLQRQQEPEQPPQSRENDTNVTSPATMLSPVTSPPYWALAHTDSLSAGPSGSHSLNNHHNNPSTESLVPGAITLQDNEADDDEEQNSGAAHHQNNNGEPQRLRTSEETRTSYGRDRNKACWAKSVEVTNYVIVNGSATNIGAFVVWNIRVQTLSVSVHPGVVFQVCQGHVKRIETGTSTIRSYVANSRVDSNLQGPYMNIRKRYSEFDDFRHRLVQSFPNFEAAVPVLPPKSVIAKFRPRFLEKRRAGLQYFLKYVYRFTSSHMTLQRILC